MPQDIGYGITRWGADESDAFYKHWDSPERKAESARRGAEYDAMSPADQKRHDDGQKAIRRESFLKNRGKLNNYGPGRDENNQRILSRGSAYEQQKARKSDPNNKLNRKRAKREAKRRMAGERMEEMKQQDSYQTQQKMKKDKGKRKDYRMS